MKKIKNPINSHAKILAFLILAMLAILSAYTIHSNIKEITPEQYKELYEIKEQNDPIYDEVMMNTMIDNGIISTYEYNVLIKLNKKLQFKSNDEYKNTAYREQITKNIYGFPRVQIALCTMYLIIITIISIILILVLIVENWDD